MVQQQSRSQFKISVFLSYPKPRTNAQQQFIDHVYAYLDDRGLAARTLGVTDYDMDAPLKAIRRPLEDYFASPEWNSLIWKWESQVRAVVDKKGNPPQLF